MQGRTRQKAIKEENNNSRAMVLSLSKQGVLALTAPIAQRAMQTSKEIFQKVCKHWAG